MTIWYIDPNNVSGVAANSGSNTASTPWLTYDYARTTGPIVDGDEIRLAHCGAVTDHALGNVTWTRNTATVSTTVSYAGVLAIGDYIGTSASGLDGDIEGGYRIKAITASTITLDTYFIGATVTEGTIRQFPVASMTDNVLIDVTANVTISGGWEPTGGSPFTTQDANKYTLMVHATSRTSSLTRGIRFQATGDISTIDRINVGYRYYGLEIAGNSVSVSNCSIIAGYVYNWYTSAAGTNATIDNCFFNGNGGTSWGVVNCAITSGVGNPTFTGGVSHIAGFNGNGRGLDGNNTGVWDFNNKLKIWGCYYGIYRGSPNIVYKNLEIDYCRYRGAYFTNGRNSGLDGCTVKNTDNAPSMYGVTFAATTASNFLRNTTVSGFLRGVDLSQAIGVDISGNTFVGNDYNIHTDVYCATTHLTGNDHGSPGIWGIYVTAGSGPVICSGETIDNEILGRAFVCSNTSYDQYKTPYLICQDAFDGKYGMYFPNFALARIAGNPPYFGYFSHGANNFNHHDLTVFSAYTNKGVGKQIDFEITCASSFTGTITPKIYLNGVDTGTSLAAITSISTGGTWDAKSYTLAAVDATADGEVEIKFNFTNTATTAIYFRLTGEPVDV